MKAYKLATLVKDSISGVQGILTHLNIGGKNSMEYVFQPKSINPSTGMPADVMFIAPERVVGGIEEEIDVPFDILGTKGEDIGTGYKGKIVNIVYHMNGCLHIGMKKEGLNQEGNTFPSIEFDIRRVKGVKLNPLTTKEMDDSKKKFPSPSKGLTKSR